jgi:hypothetical protein
VIIPRHQSQALTWAWHLLQDCHLLVIGMTCKPHGLPHSPVHHLQMAEECSVLHQLMLTTKLARYVCVERDECH